MKGLFFYLQSQQGVGIFIAMSAMDDTTFNKWLNCPLGELNSKYNTEMVNYENVLHMNTLYTQEVIEKGLLNKRFETFTSDEKEWYRNHPGRHTISKPLKYSSNIKRHQYQYLQHHLEEYYTAQELIDNGYVTVYEINDDAADMILNHAAEFSNCNIFTLINEDPSHSEYRW